MQEVMRLVKANKLLSNAMKDHLIEIVERKQVFLLKSNKTVFSCECGMQAELWSTNNYLLMRAKDAWFNQHSVKGCSPDYKTGISA